MLPKRKGLICRGDDEVPFSRPESTLSICFFLSLLIQPSPSWISFDRFSAAFVLVLLAKVAFPLIVALCRTCYQIILLILLDNL